MGTLQFVDVVDFTFTVKQDGEAGTVLAHPCLDSGQGAERNDQHLRITFVEIFLVLAQLCHMLAAGYSAQMPQEDEQDVPVFFEQILEGNFFTFGGVKGEIRGGLVLFDVWHGNPLPVKDVEGAPSGFFI